jgi:hypothetical protein
MAWGETFLKYVKGLDSAILTLYETLSSTITSSGGKGTYRILFLVSCGRE